MQLVSHNLSIWSSCPVALASSLRCSLAYGIMCPLGIGVPCDLDCFCFFLTAFFPSCSIWDDCCIPRKSSSRGSPSEHKAGHSAIEIWDVILWKDIYGTHNMGSGSQSKSEMTRLLHLSGFRETSGAPCGNRGKGGGGRGGGQFYARTVCQIGHLLVPLHFFERYTAVYDFSLISKRH